MFRAAVARLREWIAVEDADERIEGSGDPILSPEYNGRYGAERKLQEFSDTADQARDESPDRHRPPK